MEVLGPLRFTLLQILVDAELRLRVLGVEPGEFLLEPVVVLGRAIGEEGIHFLQPEVVAITNDIVDG